jgi:hypothetical protein
MSERDPDMQRQRHGEALPSSFFHLSASNPPEVLNIFQFSSLLVGGY